MVRISSKIRRLLIDEGLISGEQWEEAKSEGPDVLETLIKRGEIEEYSLMELLGRSTGIAPSSKNGTAAARASGDGEPADNTNAPSR